MNRSKLVNGTSFQTFGSKATQTIILIHGLGLCKEMWKGLVPELSKYYQVITYDLYGHGSSKPLKGKASLDVYTKQIINLMAHLEIKKVHLIGFSIGGMINRKFAMNYPEKVLSLIILNSPHRRGLKEQKIVEGRADKVHEQGVLATLDDALIRWFTENFRAKNVNKVAVVIKWRKLVDPNSYAQTARVLAFGVKELVGHQKNYTIQTLVMTCEEDSGSTPEMAREIANDYSCSEIVLIPILKHLGLMENPRAFFIPILKFLERMH